MRKEFNFVDTLLGLGNDIIEIKRIDKAIKKHGNRFLRRLFTPKEQDYCLRHKKNSAAYFAGRFAAKEAVSKAFGLGFGKEISWLDIEIINNNEGKPDIFFSLQIQKKFRKPKVFLSISHCKSYATAVAMWID